jgi:hypothetical protein
VCGWKGYGGSAKQAKHMQTGEPCGTRRMVSKVTAMGAVGPFGFSVSLCETPLTRTTAQLGLLRHTHAFTRLLL